MTEHNEMRNAFEFVTVASARARQLMEGCVPRVEGPGKAAKIAQREVAAGLVKRQEDAPRGEQ